MRTTTPSPRIANHHLNPAGADTMHLQRLLVMSILAMSATAADDLMGKSLNTAKAGTKGNSGLLILANGTRYTADVTAQGCLLRRQMEDTANGPVAKTPVEGMVVRAADGAAITWATGIEANAAVRLLVGPVVTVWLGPQIGTDGKVIQPGGWGPSVVRPEPAKGRQ